MFTSNRFGILLVAGIALLSISWQAVAAPLLNGVAVHTELGKEQFIAGLYSDSLTTDANSLYSAEENKRIQVRVLADTLSSRRFKRMWIEGIAINSNQAALEKHAQNMADFSNMLRIKLIAGDILTIDRTRDEGLSVILNGTTLGEIEDEQFFDLLLLTWVGPVPLSSGFRDSLLSAGDVSPDLLSRFEATRPSDDRIATIERAVNASEARAEQQPRPSEPAVAAVDRSSEELIAPPSLDTPSMAMLPPSLGPEEPPSTPAAKPAPAPQPEPEPEPEPAQQPAPAQQAKQEEKPAQVAKAEPATQASAESDSDIFEDDDEESFTAASLLSRQLYIGQLKKRAQGELQYPKTALRRNWEGNVRVDITIDRSGKLLNVDVIEEADHKVLTEEALRAVNEAAPFPAMPDDVAGENFLFSLPVAFKLQ